MEYQVSGEGKGTTASSHIFHNSTFWKHFQTKVQDKSWSYNFPTNLLTDTFDRDASLYSDDSVFRERRQGALKWVRNDTLWVTLVLGACKEIANKVQGVYSQQLADLHMLDAFTDYVDHLDYFQKVAHIMKSKGQPVKVFSQDKSQVHDIDKLDPVMMVSYSERFEDNISTTVWNVCVDRHTKKNPHHQAHCLWHELRPEIGLCPYSKDIRMIALREMVCDKVSRRVQKTLGGQFTDEMWDLEEVFFKGLPEEWLEKANEMLRHLKNGNGTRNI